MADYGKRQRQCEEEAAGHQNHHRTKGKRQVLADHPGSAAGEGAGSGELAKIFGHQRDIGGLQRNLAARDTHGDADIGPGQRGRVIHPVADEGHPAARRGLIDKNHLVPRQQPCVNFVGRKSQAGADAGGNLGPVTGHHQDRGPGFTKGAKG